MSGTGLRNRRKKTTSPVPMRREEQRRNRKVKGMFWASLHFSSKGHFFSHKLATSYTFTHHSRACLEVSLADWRLLSNHYLTASQGEDTAGGSFHLRHNFLHRPLVLLLARAKKDRKWTASEQDLVSFLF